MYRYNRRCSCVRCKAHALMAPALLISAGLLFLLQEFGSSRVGFEHTWPTLFIVIGVVLLYGRNASMEGHIDSAQEYVLLQHPVSAGPANVVSPLNQSEVNHG